MQLHGMHHAFWALKTACPQLPDREIRRLLREAKARNRAHGGA